MSRGRQIKKDESTCETLMELMLTHVVSQLDCTLKDLASMLEVEYLNLYGWFTKSSFPQSEDLYYNLVEKFPEMGKFGSYETLKSDYKEWKGFSVKRPTSGLIEYMKKRGYTYYKSKGKFDNSASENEARKVEKIKTNFSKFVDSLDTLGDDEQRAKGRFLKDELIRIIGDIPKNMEVDIRCITSEEEYTETLSEIESRVSELQKLTWDLNRKRILLKGLRNRFIELTEFSLDERVVDSEKKSLDRKREWASGK